LSVLAARTRRVCLVASGVAVLACSGATMTLAADDEPEGIVVQDLAFGEVLFYFYQDDYLAALTRLLAAQSRHELPTHAAEAELLLGGLYLSYGQHRIAGRIFESLLAQSVAPELHDRAWFFLAKIWYQRGYLDEADAALRRIEKALPAELEPDRQMLHAEVLMEQGRFAEALALLESWPAQVERRHASPRYVQWVNYAKYNIGVALVRLGETAAGAGVLEEIGAMELEGGDEDAYALRDKANVALGYAWLQAAAPATAKPSLQRVRLTGPFSAKALLGVGWADAEQDNYRAALAPWMELRDRSLLDAAVQESLLAVPYAFAQLGANEQAAEHYLSAIDSFNAEISRIDSAISAIESGALITELLETSDADASGWFWRLEDVPDSIESRYLYELLSTHRFQEGLKNYRDLLYLSDNLEQWSSSLGAFDDMLDTRQHAFEERLPAVDSGLAGIDIDALSARRVELESRLETIEAREDFVALGTADQQRQWRALADMEDSLALLGDDASANGLRYKHRLLRGLLEWDLRRDYKERLWRAHRDLRDLDRSLRASDRREARVVRSREDWPEEFSDKSARVAALTPRVATLVERAHELRGTQQAFLQSIAVDELEAQRERLATYVVQARFSLASIYDRAANNVPDAGNELAESAP
jgi:hypothetical protein